MIKNVVFRVITELTENLVEVERTIIDTLLSEQFSTHFGVCCVVTQSILKPTDAITKEYRQELYEMQFFLSNTTHLRLCKVAYLI